MRRLAAILASGLLCATPALAAQPVTGTDSTGSFHWIIDAGGLHIVCDSGCTGPVTVTGLTFGTQPLGSSLAVTDLNLAAGGLIPAALAAGVGTISGTMPTQANVIGGAADNSATTLLSAIFNHTDFGMLVHIAGGGLTGATSNASSGVATSSANVPTVSYNYGFNGTTWDQLQVDANKNLKVNSSNVGSTNFLPFANASVTGVSGTPTLLVAARPGGIGSGRLSVTIVQNGVTVPVFICQSAVCTVGVRLPAVDSASVTINTTSAIYGYVASGTGSVTGYEVF
jgi:hypothetical protein